MVVTVCVKNGPALAGHGAEAVCDAIGRTITTLPEELRRSLTWDQGAEIAQYALLKIAAGIQVYFCNPHSPWQRGTNENTDGLLRQYFPNGTDLSLHSADKIAAMAAAINGRPRKHRGLECHLSGSQIQVTFLGEIKRTIPRSRPASDRALRAGLVQDAACGTGAQRRLVLDEAKRGASLLRLGH